MGLFPISAQHLDPGIWEHEEVFVLHSLILEQKLQSSSAFSEKDCPHLVLIQFGEATDVAVFMIG